MEHFYAVIASVLWNAFVLMFVLALIGHPFGYFACLLFSYTAMMFLGSGVYAGTNRPIKK